MYQARGNPRLRALHTSPDAPTVDLYVDGSPAIAGLSFGEVSDYAGLSAGSHRVTVLPTGTEGRGEEVIDAELRDLEPGGDYTLALIGELRDVHAMLLSDTTAPPARGRARVRLFHASPDTPALDLVAARGHTLFRHVSFAQATPYEEVAAGMYDLDLRASGGERVIMALPDHTLAEGSLHTFVALGLLEGTPAFFIMPLVEAVAVLPPA